MHGNAKDKIKSEKLLPFEKINNTGIKSKTFLFLTKRSQEFLF